MLKNDKKEMKATTGKVKEEEEEEEKESRSNWLMRTSMKEGVNEYEGGSVRERQ